MAVGHVRVSMPVDLGIHHVAPLIPAFSKQHPGITVEFDLSPNNRDLVGEHVDLAIRIGAVKGNALIVRRIGTVEMRAYTAPAYLSQRGAPRQPTDLDQHQCLTLPAAGGEVVWGLVGRGEAVNVSLRPHLTANSMGFLTALAEGGLGVAVLPTRVARHAVQSGRLVPVLPDWTWPDLPVNAVMSSRLQPASVRAFVAFLAAQLATV